MMQLASSQHMEYERRLAVRKLLAEQLEQRSTRISNFRLLTGVIGLVILWFILRGALNVWWIAAPVTVFGALVIWHDRARKAITKVQRAINFYEWGLARIEDRWHGFGSKGERFRKPDHVYAEDLDILGEQSLFQLLSTARTRMGEEELAKWLLSPASIKTVLSRQKAVAELRNKVDFREELAVAGEDIPAEFDPARLVEWAEGPEQLRNATVRVAAMLLAIVAVVTIVLALWQKIYLPAAVVILIEVAIHNRFRRQINYVIENVEGAGESLLLFSTLLRVLKKQRFDAELLKQLHSKISNDNDSAWHALKVFSTRVDWLESSHHMLIRVLNIPLLYELQIAFALESWRDRHGHKIRKWLNAITEIEALNSLAAYAYEHPADPFPEFVMNGPSQFVGEALGHPLIPSAKCVRNSVRLDSTTRVLLVSGSNMSGKSTYLRTIGMNTVLAMAGAPVRAKSLRLSPLQVGSSLHVVDSLQTGRSGFASELDRLRQIMGMMNDRIPVIFLLDELLHGTNSHDRYLGGLALLKAFAAKGTIGVVTTHDLAITNVPPELNSLTKNVHFEDRVENGQMVFDYILRDGAVTRSNALELMRSIGLNV